MQEPEELTELGRAESPRGEVVLRRRGFGDTAVTELIINGAFAMDSAETLSERALAALPVTYAGATVLLGGLGLGYTAESLLHTDAARIEVVELEPALIGWARAGLTPVLGGVVADPRIRLVCADVATVLADPAEGPWDLILLDVDNGPDFLIHAGNAALYADSGLRRACERLHPGGTLAIWCQGPSQELTTAMGGLGRVGTHTYKVQRGRRQFSYVIYTLQAVPDP